MRRIVAAAPAIVMPSLFEEEILQDEIGSTGRSKSAPATLRGPRLLPGRAGVATPVIATCSLVEIKRRVDVPVIASLNGTSPGWVRYASLLADAGADAIELNLYYVAADPTPTAADVEARYARPRRGGESRRSPSRSP